MRMMHVHGYHAVLELGIIRCFDVSAENQQSPYTPLQKLHGLLGQEMKDEETEHVNFFFRIALTYE